MCVLLWCCGVCGRGGQLVEEALCVGVLGVLVVVCGGWMYEWGPYGFGAAGAQEQGDVGMSGLGMVCMGICGLVMAICAWAVVYVGWAVLSCECYVSHV